MGEKEKEKKDKEKKEKKKKEEKEKATVRSAPDGSDNKAIKLKYLRNVVEDTGLQGDFHLESLMPSKDRLLPLALLLALFPHPHLKGVSAPVKNFI